MGHSRARETFKLRMKRRRREMRRLEQLHSAAEPAPKPGTGKRVSKGKD
jgi:hypothetical protein